MRRLQVFRVVAYVATPVNILWALWVILTLCTARLMRYGGNYGQMEALIATAWILAAVMLGVFLRAGLKHYLQLTRASLVAITTAGVAMLFLLTALLWLRFG